MTLSTSPLAAPPATPVPPHARPIARRPARSHTGGRRLADAFAALDTFPALAESRDRLLGLLGAHAPSAAKITATIESDLALAIAALRRANQDSVAARGSVSHVAQAVDALSLDALVDLAHTVPTYDFFDRGTAWGTAPERLRLHGAATQHAVARLAAVTGRHDTGSLITAALLHDVGKLALARAHPDYERTIQADRCTPDERVLQERRALGVDHALVGGVLLRRWGLPKELAAVVERHHAFDAYEDAGYLRLADMLAHQAQGRPVDELELAEAAGAIGLGADDLRAVMFDVSYAPRESAAIGPCPLSRRELGILKGLAQGKVYKDIAPELELSVSTIRTHLHNIQGKLGVASRAQAVLYASERGWLR